MTELATTHDVVPDDAPVSTTRWSRRWILLLVVPILLLGVSVWAFTLVTGDARDADRSVERHRVLVVHARQSSKAALADLEATHADAISTRVKVAGPLATVEGMVQMAGQGLAASEDALRAGTDLTPAGVVAYNEAVTRSNVLGEQFDGAFERLEEQLRSLVGIELETV
jgi:hypothetical protein